MGLEEGDYFPSTFEVLEFLKEGEESLLSLLIRIQDDVLGWIINQTDGETEDEFPFLGFC